MIRGRAGPNGSKYETWKHAQMHTQRKWEIKGQATLIRLAERAKRCVARSHEGKGAHLSLPKPWRSGRFGKACLVS